MKTSARPWRVVVGLADPRMIRIVDLDGCTIAIMEPGLDPRAMKGNADLIVRAVNRPGNKT